MAKAQKVKLAQDAVLRMKKKKPTKSPRAKPNRSKPKQYRGQGHV